MKMEIVEADLDSAEHARDVVALTAAYACDSMGNGGPLAADVMDRLVPALRAHPTTRIFLLYRAGRAVAIATCFLGFSTFQARPLLNIHDFAVLSSERRAGLGKLLMEAVVAKAAELGCCKVTLEVQENNHPARRLYERIGFAQAVYGETTGGSLFYSMQLSPNNALQATCENTRA
jgi:GNAT superfamily N-acetyltransferase